MFFERKLEHIPSKPMTGFTPGEGEKFLREFKLSPEWENKCMNCTRVREKLFFCSNCSIIKYCSKECQKANWAKHRLDCHDVHGVRWILKVYSDYEKSLFSRGIEDNLFSSEKIKQSVKDGGDIRGCAPTLQVLTRLLTQYPSEYYYKVENMLKDLN